MLENRRGVEWRGSEQGLNAVLGDIVVGVLLHFAEDDVQQRGDGEDVVMAGCVGLSFGVAAESVEPFPDVLHQVHAIAVECEVDVDKHLHVAVKQLQLLHNGPVNVYGKRIRTLPPKIT